MAVHVVHPHVTQVEGILGGKPVISGTRTPVRSVVAYHALSFYYDQQAEIDADLDANREEYVRRRLTGEDPSLPF